MNIIKESCIIDLNGEQAMLLCQRAMFLKTDKVLLLSDLHIGKSSHFRREGVAVPSSIYSSDLLKLGQLIRQLDAKKVFILGDLFHVGHDDDVDLFNSWRYSYRDAEIVLIKGNHDRLEINSSRRLGIELVDEYILKGKFLLRHVPGKYGEEEYLIICGHIHPAVRVFGKGRQSAMLSCFHLSNQRLVLPAFGEFTGRHVISPNSGDRVFAVIDDGDSGKVIEIK